MSRQETCTTIAFYDLDKQSIDYRELFYFFEQWFLMHGYTPMRGSADGEGIKATQTWTFKYTKKLLEKRNFEKISGFWFGAYPPEWSFDATDAVFSVELDAQDHSLFYFYFHNSILSYNKSTVETLIKEISQYLKTYYGIVYLRDFDKGPGLYASGIITGLNSYKFPEQAEEEERIAEWHRSYFRPERYHLGKLRDIYPMNLLSEAHLNQIVFGKTLKDWIESSPEHGELNPLTDILWEWWVPGEKISSVREALRSTGLLICI